MKLAHLSFGDLTQTFQIRRLSSGLKSDLTRLSLELTTGRKDDLGATLAGDFGPYAGIERSLRAIKAYTTANNEAAGMFSAAQLALEHVQASGQDSVPGLLTAASARDVTLIHATAEDARQKLESVVSTFNTRFADRALFAGAATDGASLAPATTMIEAIKIAVAGETTATGITAAVDVWFDAPGGGFETSGYLGSGSDMGPLIIADGEKVAVETRADDPAVRETLKSFVLAALIAEGALAGNVDAQADLIAEASERMLASDGQLTTLRARIGAIEARVEDAQARNAAEQAAYELSRTELVGVDPYQTASELEAVYAQVETLYTVTARVAGLNFADYLR